MTFLKVSKNAVWKSWSLRWNLPVKTVSVLFPTLGARCLCVAVCSPQHRKHPASARDFPAPSASQGYLFAYRTLQRLSGIKRRVAINPDNWLCQSLSRAPWAKGPWTDLPTCHFAKSDAHSSPCPYGQPRSQSDTPVTVVTEFQASIPAHKRRKGDWGNECVSLQKMSTFSRSARFLGLGEGEENSVGCVAWSPGRWGAAKSALWEPEM